jgi:uncharacterized lipoprotein YddW (UPF0748 family)
MRGVRGAFAAMLAVLALTAPYATAWVRPTVCIEPYIPCPKPAPDPAPPKPGSAKPNPVAYHGLGTWVDAYDYSREYGGRSVTPASVDNMAKQGVKTIYIQAAKDKNGGPTGVLSSDLLGQILERAHAKSIRVVAWYLPRLVDSNRDWAHLDAILKFRSHDQAFDSVGIDIESREEGNVNTRNNRLVALSTKLRKAAPGMALSAIVVPPVVTDKINPSFWSPFPWAKIKPSYDVWVPMSYYTNRTKQPEYRDAYKYSSDNVKLLRQDLGNASAVVHVAGGIGNQSTTKDYDGLVRAAKDTKCAGISSYDYATTASRAWATLRKSPA